MRCCILHVLCEGQTEERFVREVLAPYLGQHDIFPKPILLLTSKKKNARGGMVSYPQARRDLGILMKRYRDNAAEHHIFTTMFDYYALPDEFPGTEKAMHIQDVRQRIAMIEEEFWKEVGSDAFVPYIQLHEFEALLFTDICRLTDEYPHSEAAIRQLKAETDPLGDPEMINSSQETAPSKRIIKALEGYYHYNKVKSGATITSLIGMERMLQSCRHFREWVERIITLAGG